MIIEDETYFNNTDTYTASVDIGKSINVNGKSYNIVYGKEGETMSCYIHIVNGPVVTPEPTATPTPSVTPEPTNLPSLTVAPVMTNSPKPCTNPVITNSLATAKPSLIPTAYPGEAGI